MTVQTLKSVRQQYPAHRAVLLLLFLGWFTTAAAGACLPHGSLSVESGNGPNSHAHSILAGDADDISDACCVASSNALRSPLLDERGSSAEPRLVALPVPAVPQHVDTVPASWRVPPDIDTAVSHLPLYLLYRRLLIPSFG